MRLAVATTLMSLAACTLPVEEAAYEEQLVVFGHLTANRLLEDTVFVSRSFAIEESQEDTSKWVADALVTLTDGNTTTILAPVAGRPGRYLDLAEPPIIIEPGKTYTLEVTWEDRNVSATTAVPESFHLESIRSTVWFCREESVLVDSIDLYEDENRDIDWRQVQATGDFSALVMDTVVYREGHCYTTSFASVPLMLLRWSGAGAPGVVRTTTQALDDRVANAIVDTSLAALAFKGPMFEDAAGRYYRDGVLTWNSVIEYIGLSWLFFNYYGPHRVTVEITDEVYRTYLEGDPLRQNPFLLPQGNVDGGYGLFYASFARTFYMVVVPEPSNSL